MTKIDQHSAPSIFYFESKAEGAAPPYDTLF